MPPRKKTKGKINGVERLALAFPASPAGFPALPLDILFEIFSLLHPLDLLYLTRTTKPFRRFLLNSSNAAIWRAAFATSIKEGGPPGCPTYMCEPAWARVAFEKTCHICLASLRDDPNVDSVWWEFAARYCGDCMGSLVSKSISVKVKRLDPKRKWEVVFPRVPRYPGTSTWYYYLIAHQRELIDAYVETESPELRAAIIQKRTEQTHLIMQHSQLCRNWAQEQIRSRQKQAAIRQRQAEDRRREENEKKDATKRSRLQAIVEKLTALGWSDEPWMSGGTLSQQIRWYPSVDVPTEFTPRAYNELEPALLLRLNADKRAAILNKRLDVFRMAFPLIINNTEIENLALSVRPRLPDILLIPAVRTLIEEKGEDEISSDQLVHTLRSVMPTLLKVWAREAMAQIVAHAHRFLNSDPEVPDVLGLAIAHVKCPRNCGATGYFPKLFKHSCLYGLHWLHQRYTQGKNDANAYESLVEDRFYENCFTPTMLQFGSRLQALESVVRAYGRDPKTTTYTEIAREMRLVICGKCVANPKRSKLRERLPHSLDWLQAMDHCTDAHLQDADFSWELSGKSRESGFKFDV
ncbi:hypothetical protein C8R44DRAFT_893043 [Mycena epipterygia]|nr:hypothetical protein C8R44DRAFT_893043 [Mycena epipterygia]